MSIGFTSVLRIYPCGNAFATCNKDHVLGNDDRGGKGLRTGYSHTRAHRHTFAIIRIHATATEENFKINRAAVIIIHLERSVCFIIIILVMRR